LQLLPYWSTISSLSIATSWLIVISNQPLGKLKKFQKNPERSVLASNKDLPVQKNLNDLENSFSNWLLVEVDYNNQPRQTIFNKNGVRKKITPSVGYHVLTLCVMTMSNHLWHDVMAKATSHPFAYPWRRACNKKRCRSNGKGKASRGRAPLFNGVVLAFDPKSMREIPISWNLARAMSDKGLNIFWIMCLASYMGLQRGPHQ
jgi:hypothetical protein